MHRPREVPQGAHPHPRVLECALPCGPGGGPCVLGPPSWNWAPSPQVPLPRPPGILGPHYLAGDSRDRDPATPSPHHCCLGGCAESLGAQPCDCRCPPMPALVLPDLCVLVPGRSCFRSATPSTS